MITFVVEVLQQCCVEGEADEDIDRTRVGATGAALGGLPGSGEDVEQRRFGGRGGTGGGLA